MRLPFYELGQGWNHIFVLIPFPEPQQSKVIDIEEYGTNILRIEHTSPSTSLVIFENSYRNADNWY